MLPKKLTVKIGKKISCMGECALSLLSSDENLQKSSKIPIFVAYNPRIGDIYIDDAKNYSKLGLGGYKFYTNVTLDHASTCPCFEMKLKPSLYTFESSSKLLKAAVCIIVIDSQSNVLLTRRSKTLYTYPKAWVNPGGQIDFGESFEECGLRELKEETGIDITMKDNYYIFDNKVVHYYPFYAYESVYPTNLEYGLPKSQTICFFYALELQTQNSKIVLKLSKDECDAYIWKNLKELMVNIEEPLNFAGFIKGKNVQNENIEISLASIQGIYPNQIEEGIGQGHLLALKHYYSLRDPAIKGMNDDEFNITMN